MRSRPRLPTIGRSTPTMWLPQKMRHPPFPRRLTKAAMGITLTENAAKHVAAHLTIRGRGVGLRLAVRTSGCSGLAYKLEYADDIRPEDHRFESHGITVVVDPKSLPYLEGTELDFAREGLN